MWFRGAAFDYLSQRIYLVLSCIIEFSFLDGFGYAVWIRATSCAHPDQRF